MKMLERCEEEASFGLSTVRQLLRSRKTTIVVLGFLTDTQVGLQPRKQEQREKEQERHRDET